MIEEIEVVEKIRRGGGTIYKYKFKLNGTIFHSQYNVGNEPRIHVFRRYCEDLDLQTEPIPFSKESMEKIRSFILKQKEIRLRHLMNPYTFL